MTILLKSNKPADVRRSRTVRLEWDWSDMYAHSGWIVNYGTEAEERYRQDETGQAAAYWSEVWEYRTYEAFRDELLRMRKEVNYDDRLEVHDFITKDGYVAFVSFYVFDSAWTIHLYQP